MEREHLPYATLRQAKRLVRGLVYRHYDTARAYYRTRLVLRLAFARARDPLLIYTMGKVGSTSVSKSLMASGIDRPVYHVHSLAPERLAVGRNFYRDSARRHQGTPKGMRFRPEFLWRSEHVAAMMRKHPTKRWQVVTLVRDPVARNISAFFEQADTDFYYWIDRELVTNSVDDVARELVELFLAKIRKDSFAGQFDTAPLTWFDEEFCNVLGIDVFEQYFPKRQGFQIIRSPRADVLLLRLEDLDRCAEEAFRQFLGFNTYRQSRKNVSESKRYAATYRKFLEMIQLPIEYLDCLYASKIATHFYSQAEIDGFRAKWKY